MEDYFYVLPDDKAVQIWSSRRLPFETDGQMLNLKESTRASISKLRANPDGILYGMYSSMEEGNFDVENVLFYNVGSRPLSKLARRGIRFERVVAGPPACPDSKSYGHYCFYDVGQTEFRRWARKSTLAVFESHFDSFADLKKPELIWYSTKRDSKRVGAASPHAKFGISVTIAYRKDNVSLASNMKTVLDGTIAAFQTNTSNDAEVIRIVARKLSLNEIEVEKLLFESNSILGGTRLASKRGEGVHWTPSDDRLAAAELLLKHISPIGVELSGEIFTVAPIERT